MKKRGQTTLFIILGIIIVLLIILVFVFKENVFPSAAVSMPEEAQKVNDYVTNCLDEVTEEPLILIGLQGGYIDVPDDPIPDMPLNQFSNALEILPESEFKTAYWFYETANGVQKDQQPTKSNMEAELADYVVTHLAECMTDFDFFEENGLETTGEIEADVEILDDSVVFDVNYPITMQKDNFIFSFDEFTVEQDVPLGRLYDVASEIYDSENEDLYLEGLTFDIMSIYEEIPLSGVDFDCEIEEWDVDEVKEWLQYYVSGNLNLLTIKNTDTKQDDKYYLWDALLWGAQDVSIEFRYSEQWPFYMQVEPSFLGKLKEDTMAETYGHEATAILNAFLCMENHNFIYDIKYPVLISLYDAEKDYTFQFANQVILDNNQPRENMAQAEAIEIEDDFICPYADMPMTIYALEVADDGTLVEVPDAVVSFKCINNVCPIGTTSGRYGDAYLRADFPQCVNGYVIVEKDGLIRGKEMVTTTDESTVSVILDKEYELEFEFLIDDGDTIRSLKSDEIATVFLTHAEKEYFAYASWPEGDETIKLIPGEYDLTALLVSEDMSYKLESYEYEKCVSVPQKGLLGIFGFTYEECSDYEFDPENMDSVVIGGMETKWDVDRSELLNADKITFKLFAYDVDNDEEVEEAVSAITAGIGIMEPELS